MDYHLLTQVIGFALSVLAVGYLVKFAKEKPMRPLYVLGSMIWLGFALGIILKHWR